MARTPLRHSNCPRCGALLARDNTSGRCAPCQAAERDRLVSPLALPTDFWDHEPIRQALVERHLGRVIRAYRHHPYHGHDPLPQQTVGRWLGITQAQMSRLENGRPIVHLDRLTHWAKILRIPGHLLWFKLPVEKEAADGGQADMTRRSLLAAGGALVVSVHGFVPEISAYPAPGQLNALAGLRTLLSNYLSGQHADPVPSLQSVQREIARVHVLYQRAQYEAAARLLPGVLDKATSVAEAGPRSQQVDALQALAAAYIAASKLASKAGDSETALLTADRAATAARLADDRAMSAVAAYQAACALANSPGKLGRAERITHTSIDELKIDKSNNEPNLISAAGALLLLAAIIAARQKQAQDAKQYLARAGHLAAALGSDENRLWTGFGPTNVAVHEVSAAVQSDQPNRAIEIGDGLDTSRLPAALLGRRAQVHLDLASATAAEPDGDSVAVLHLLEAERVAPEVLRFDIRSRSLLVDLLNRGRRSATPGLRPMAMRAGLLT